MLCLELHADGTISRIPLRAGRLRLGRAPDGEVVVRSRGVSARHAELLVGEGGLELRDVGSRNGTWVRGSRTETARLAVGDCFHLGRNVRCRITELDTDDLILAEDQELPSERSWPRLAPDAPTEPSMVDGAGREEVAGSLLGALAETPAGPARVSALLAAGMEIGGARGALLFELDDDGQRLRRQVGETDEPEAKLLAALRDRLAAGDRTGWLGDEDRWAFVESEGTVLLLHDPGAIALGPLRHALALASEGDARPAPRAEGATRVLELRVPGGDIVSTRSPALQALHARMCGALGSDLPVLLLGETGTGKELHARALHDCSLRASGSFRAVNAGALPASLLESLLFGAVKGAATGVDASSGLLRQAHGGSFFLDEIGEMSLELQAKLLRVLDSGECLPVGATEPIRVNVRIIAATNRELEAAVEAGDFRRDLWYRLAGHVFELPPLRERREDVQALAESFLRQECERIGRKPPGFTVKALRALEGHAWPGNIRELETLMRRLAHEHAEGEPIRCLDLPASLRRSESAAPEPDAGATLDEQIDVFQRPLIERVLAECGGNRSAAAEALGISRPRLKRTLEKLGLDTED